LPRVDEVSAGPAVQDAGVFETPLHFEEAAMSRVQRVIIGQGDQVEACRGEGGDVPWTGSDGDRDAGRYFRLVRICAFAISRHKIGNGQYVPDKVKRLVRPVAVDQEVAHHSY